MTPKNPPGPPKNIPGASPEPLGTTPLFLPRNPNLARAPIKIPQSGKNPQGPSRDPPKKTTRDPQKCFLGDLTPSSGIPRTSGTPQIPSGAPHPTSNPLQDPWGGPPKSSLEFQPCPEPCLGHPNLPPQDLETPWETPNLSWRTPIPRVSPRDTPKFPLGQPPTPNSVPAAPVKAPEPPPSPPPPHAIVHMGGETPTLHSGESGGAAGNPAVGGVRGGGFPSPGRGFRDAPPPSPRRLRPPQAPGGPRPPEPPRPRRGQIQAPAPGVGAPQAQVGLRAFGGHGGHFGGDTGDTLGGGVTSWGSLSVPLGVPLGVTGRS